MEEIAIAWQKALMVVCLSGLLLLLAVLVLRPAVGLIARMFSQAAKRWRVSRLHAVLRTGATCAFFFVAYLCGAIKPGGTNGMGGVSHAPRRTPPAVVVSEDGQQGVEVMDPGSVESAGEGFRVVSYSFTNDVMDLVCAWDAGSLGFKGVEALYGGELGDCNFLGDWPLPWSRNSLRIIVRPQALGLDSSGFVHVRPIVDSDEDGVSDWHEEHGLHSSSLAADSDGDGLPDEFEARLGLDATADDYYDAPITLAGEGTGLSLAAALAGAGDYSIIEVQPGVYDANLVLPDRPILITTSNRGRNRQVVFKCTQPYGISIPEGRNARSVIRGIKFDLSNCGDLCAGVWVGGALPFGGRGGTVVVQGCRFTMSSPASHMYGVYSRYWHDSQLVISSCEFNAAGAAYACGVSLVDSPRVLIENCSFLNFPGIEGGWTAGVHAERTPDNRGGAAEAVSLNVVSTLFDNSFTNSVSIECRCPTNGYDIALSGCAIPEALDVGTVSQTNVIVGSVAVNSRGYLLPGSSGIGTGVTPVYSSCDVNGVAIESPVDVGAARYVSPTSDQDTDQDGIRDWDEIDLYGTDPFLSDSDGDFMDDLLEIDEGTSPVDRTDYCFSSVVEIENPAGERTPASVALFSSAATGGMPISQVVRATNLVDSLVVSHRRSTGEHPYRLVAWNDTDGDGRLDEGETVYVTKPYSPNAHAATGRFSLPSPAEDADNDGVSDWNEVFVWGTNMRQADTDGDHIGDSEELEHLTDPLNRSNYCFAVEVAITNQVPEAGSFLCALATSNETGFALLSQPYPIAHEATDSIRFPHETVSDGSPRYVVSWFDHNTNGLWDVERELLAESLIRVTSHTNNVVRIRITSRHYDRDDDGMPDWWELGHALNPLVADSLLDEDLDGIVNLHEYWLGSDPSTSNRTDSALSLVVESVDGRISNLTNRASLAKFNNYRSNGASGVFIENPDFWAKDVDTSCASMWNSFTTNGQFRKAGTLISPRHMLFANHFPAEIGRYVVCKANNGAAFTNIIMATERVLQTDLQVALLQEEMPTNIVPAFVLPKDYQKYIGTGRGLPVIAFDYDEKCIVYALERDLSTHALTSGHADAASMRNEFYEHLVTGDSGNPLFILAGDTPLLVGIAHYGNHLVRRDVYLGGAYTSIVHYYDDVQHVMDELCEGYAIQQYDLSNFPILPLFQGVSDEQ